MKTQFLLVLHGHIPDVLGHGVWPHGANWLYEAAAETYLPFLSAAERLRREGVPFAATVGMTPVLCEQLRDDRFAAGFPKYLVQRANAAEEDREELANKGDGHIAWLAERWRDRYAALAAQYDALPGRDIVRAFADLARAGYVEPIASAATHGFLPLLPDDRAIERQLDVGLEAHAAHFGTPARGIWLPECAYRPGGPWTSPVDGHVEIRRGLEEFLAPRGIRYFFVETHLVAGGTVRPAYGGVVVREEEGHSPYRAHALTAAPTIAVLARDPLSSQQVWSGKVGYPGDGRYLEFHKKRAPSGHRYWRITQSYVDLGSKLPYVPDEIAAALDSHSYHFQQLLESVPPFDDGTAPLIVSMFDFELFGHWWWEGIDFLERVFRRLAAHERIVATTSWQALQAAPPKDALELAPGTWGRGGDFQVWWNDHTVPFWREVDATEKRMEDFEARAKAGDLSAELFEALERQCLLLQSSDWPFLIDNAVSRDYAERRIRCHVEDFWKIARMAESGDVDHAEIARIGERDRLFAEELRGRVTV